MARGGAEGRLELGRGGGQRERGITRYHGESTIDMGVRYRGLTVDNIYGREDEDEGEGDKKTSNRMYRITSPLYTGPAPSPSPPSALNQRRASGVGCRV